MLAWALGQLHLSCSNKNQVQTSADSQNCHPQKSGANLSLAPVGLLPLPALPGPQLGSVLGRLCCLSCILCCPLCSCHSLLVGHSVLLPADQPLHPGGPHSTQLHHLWVFSFFQCLVLSPPEFGLLVLFFHLASGPLRTFLSSSGSSFLVFAGCF